MSETNGTSPITEAAAHQAIADLKRSLFDNAFPALVARLEAHKAQHGMEGMDQAVVGEALLAFALFLNGNQKLVVGADTDLVLSIGIEIFAAAAVEAKKRVDNQRIILLK